MGPKKKKGGKKVYAKASLRQTALSQLQDEEDEDELSSASEGPVKKKPNAGKAPKVKATFPNPADLPIRGSRAASSSLDVVEENEDLSEGLLAVQGASRAVSSSLSDVTPSAKGVPLLPSGPASGGGLLLNRTPASALPDRRLATPLTQYHLPGVVHKANEWMFPIFDKFEKKYARIFENVGRSAYKFKSNLLCLASFHPVTSVQNKVKPGHCDFLAFEVWNRNLSGCRDEDIWKWIDFVSHITTVTFLYRPMSCGSRSNLVELVWNVSHTHFYVCYHKIGVCYIFF